MISTLWTALFGDRAAGLRDTIQIFRENAEGRAERGQALRLAALDQFAAEFAAPRKSRFDHVMDGVNRLPRPMLALGTLGLMGSAMVNPVWFAARMQGVAVVPEPLWWLLGIIVSFYFGARAQVKSQDFQRAIAASLAQLPRQSAPEDAPQEGGGTLLKGAENPALLEWLRRRDAQG